MSQAPTALGKILGALGPAFEVAFRARGLAAGLVPGRARREAAALEALCARPRFAPLRRYRELAPPAREALEAAYARYVAGVSPAWMAVSLELAVFLLVLARALRPGRVVDLGSGFSSLVFRRYRQEAGPAPEVWSVDDSPGWLERTGEFLAAEGLPADGLATWETFAADPPGGLDLVLHDLGSLACRRRTLPQALDLLGPDGVLVLDDANYASVRRRAVRVLRARGLRVHRLGALTRDRYGRYALLAARARKSGKCGPDPSGCPA
ncbi:MAG: hypothetical protein ACLF0G_14840 [Candidatus Brocadiia bacterium]